MGNISEWLCEDVSKIFRGWSIFDDDPPIFDTFTYEVMTNVDMLDMGVVLHILGEGYCTVIVIIENCRLWSGKVNLIHSGIHPLDLFHRSCKGHILSFGSGKGYSLLIL